MYVCMHWTLLVRKWMGIVSISTIMFVHVTILPEMSLNTEDDFAIRVRDSCQLFQNLLNVYKPLFVVLNGDLENKLN